MSRFLEVSYAVSVAISQALVTFASVRGEQRALAEMSVDEIQGLLSDNTKSPIGFVRNNQ